MSLRIFDSSSSLAAQRHLDENLASQKKAMERLSSGSRVNDASDDAAGLALSEKLRAQIHSARQNMRNAQDGISSIQIAEGGMNEISSILVRLKELAIQSASETTGDTEREFIEKEVQQLKQEVDRIAQSTEFNGKKLLNGEGEILSVQVGPGNRELVDRYELDSSKLKANLDALSLTDLSLLDQDDAQDVLPCIDAAQDLVVGSRVELGAFQNRLQSSIRQLALYEENLSEARGRITDADIAQESSELMKSNILISVGIAVLSQAHLNSARVLKLIAD